jgi:hypothetical protein
MELVPSRTREKFTAFWWGEQGIAALLPLLLAALFLAPFFDSYLLRSLSGLFFTLLLASGVAYLSPRPLLRRLAGALALAAIILHWLNEFKPIPALAIATQLIALLCFSGLTLVLLIRVFRDSGPVTSARVRGAIAAYVLLGVTWSILYQLLDLCLPEALSLSTIAATTADQRRETFTYFSFVTLTTLGYGDIVPVHPIARMFVVFEALIGQLYPATLLARLVSQEISHHQRENAVPMGTGYAAGATPSFEPDSPRGDP